MSAKLKISLQEVRSATNDFARENIIGGGGYGPVYKGHSEKHGILAIKRLNLHGGQGEHEYGMEVALLSKFKHENLVSLVGFCGEAGEKIIIYKYEAKGSLENHLRSKYLSWMSRLEICLGAACGLRYLHDETRSGHGSVIHRDMKSSNVLLDENWKPKISDFGLSKIALTSSADSVLYTMACGTHGYVDPQTLYGRGITQKSDVYSFGVVLFEVLFQKLVAVPGYIGDERFTVKMAQKHYEKKTLDKMIDADLRSQMNTDSLNTFSTVAYRCLKNVTEERPTMSMVVEALQEALTYQQVSNESESSIGFLHDVYISSSIHYILSNSLLDELKREQLSTYNGCSGDELLRASAIKSSRAFIIIFSKKLVQNPWNLDEVEEIVKCMKERGSAVLPVFDGLYPNGPPKLVPASFPFHDDNLKREVWEKKREVWEKAVVEACNLPGIQVSNYRDQDEAVKEIVRNVKLLLRTKSPIRCSGGHACLNASCAHN